MYALPTTLSSIARHPLKERGRTDQGELGPGICRRFQRRKVTYPPGMAIANQNHFIGSQMGTVTAAKKSDLKNVAHAHLLHQAHRPARPRRYIFQQRAPPDTRHNANQRYMLGESGVVSVAPNATDT